VAIAQSKVTAQGQISVPLEVRKRLGIGPGSVLEWDEHEGAIVVRKLSRFTSEDLHRAAFGDTTPQKRTLDELKQGIAQYMKSKHARR
jgi:AbrB family looped-hinge helix DNA binding protein